MRSDSIHSASSKRVGRHHFPVVGAVGVGRSVQQRAGALQRREIALVVVLGALEHQVLEEMREAGAARRLVLRADVIPEVHRHDRAGVILVDEHVEPVGERVLA